MKRKVFSTVTTNGNKTVDWIKEKFNTAKAKAQYIHSSHFSKKNRQPIEIGEWENIEVIGNDVFADLKLNEKGKLYEESFGGISAEIPENGVCNTICLLPLGVKQAVAGAEYEEVDTISYDNVIEYEKKGVKMVTKEEVLEYMKDEAKRKEIMAEYEAKPTPKPAEVLEMEKQLADSKAKIEEFEAKEYEAKVEKVLTDNKTRLIGNLPRIAKAALMSTVKDSTVIEFEAGKDKITAFEQYKKDIEGLKDFAYLTQEYQSNAEKPNKEKSIDDYKKDVEKMHGGGKK